MPGEARQNLFLFSFFFAAAFATKAVGAERMAFGAAALARRGKVQADPATQVLVVQAAVEGVIVIVE